MASLLAGAEQQPLNQEDADFLAGSQGSRAERDDDLDSDADGRLEPLSESLAWPRRYSGSGKRPTGWAEACGLYRMIGRLFFCITVLTVFFMLHNLVCRDFPALLINVVLLVASIICGLAAYVHEGLINEVSEMAVENDRFSAMSTSLRTELGQLGPVRERLDELADTMRGDEEKLEQALKQLSHLTHVNRVTEILDAFRGANEDVDVDKANAHLTGEELVNFMNRIRPVLENSIPSFNYDDLAKEVFPQCDEQITFEAQLASLSEPRQEKGLSYGAMKLLIAVCIRCGDEFPGVSMALLGLLLFSMNVSKYMRFCSDALVALFGDEYETLDSAQEDIDESLHRISADGNNFIYLDHNLWTAPEFRALYSRVLQKQAKPEE